MSPRASPVAVRRGRERTDRRPPTSGNSRAVSSTRRRRSTPPPPCRWASRRAVDDAQIGKPAIRTSPAPRLPMFCQAAARQDDRRPAAGRSAPPIGPAYLPFACQGWRINLPLARGRSWKCGISRAVPRRRPPGPSSRMMPFVANCHGCIGIREAAPCAPARAAIRSSKCLAIRSEIVRIIFEDRAYHPVTLACSRLSAPRC